MAMVGWPGLTFTLKTTLVSDQPILDVAAPGGGVMTTTRLTAIHGG
jgi:hypothetical protein